MQTYTHIHGHKSIVIRGHPQLYEDTHCILFAHYSSNHEHQP